MTTMFKKKQFGCQTRFMLSISSYQVKISGLYPLLHGFTALNRIGEFLIKRLIIILIKRLTKENKKLNICQIQDIWKLLGKERKL